jgi:hypothetical protein
MFIERESYKHLFAKETLASWFFEEEKGKDFCQVAQFWWRSNYGVYKELPFYETSEVYYFEGGENSGKIIFVPDVTIFHKGTPSLFLEVVHKHPTPQWKIEKIKKFFQKFQIDMYEIEAEEILKHDKKSIPNYLECKQLI